MRVSCASDWLIHFVRDREPDDFPASTEQDVEEMAGRMDDSNQQTPQRDLQEFLQECDGRPEGSTSCDCDIRWECTECGFIGCPECIYEVEETIDGAAHCSACSEKIVAENEDVIEEYVAQLKITGEVAQYDPAHHWAPTPDEYAAGFKEAYTENSVGAFNQHCRTNYDDLIRNLDRGDAFHRAVYEAVCARVAELLGAAERLPERTGDEGLTFVP